MSAPTWSARSRRASPRTIPRNPAVIADNVGDNVGDCAGMAADLFETYAVTAVAVMLLGTQFPAEELWLYPLAIGGMSILASVIGTFFARLGRGANADHQRALQGRHRRHAALRARLHPVTLAFDGGAFSFWKLYGSALIGLAVTFLLVAITEYYTGTRWPPVKQIAKASQTGHATNIIEGLAVGMQATALPVIVIAAGIVGAYYAAGESLFGIGVAVMAQLSMTGLIVALDAYGPVTDNAGGIAEMADLPEEVRGVTDPLDAVGNTTKAVTKGYAIGSAGLAALVLFDGYISGPRRRGAADDLQSLRSLGDRRALHRRPDAVPVRVARDAGGRRRRRPGRRGGAPPVPGDARDHGGHRSGPSTAAPSSIVTASAIKYMMAPALIPVAVPDRRRHHQRDGSAGCSIGTIVTGIFLAISMTSGGGAWDNAKKIDRGRLYGGKGSDAHAASITGDTVGDPYKDTAGPAINPMIKITNIVAILIIPIVVSIHT